MKFLTELKLRWQIQKPRFFTKLQKYSLILAGASTSVMTLAVFDVFVNEVKTVAFGLAAFSVGLGVAAQTVVSDTSEIERLKKEKDLI